MARTYGALCTVSCLRALTFCLHCWHWYCLSPPSNCSAAVKFASALCKESAWTISRLKSKNGSNLLEQYEHCKHLTCRSNKKTHRINLSKKISKLICNMSKNSLKPIPKKKTGWPLTNMSNIIPGRNKGLPDSWGDLRRSCVPNSSHKHQGIH